MYTFATVGEDGNVIYVGDQPGFRAACEWLHTLYEEGLLDPESLTQDSNLWANKVNAGEVGAFNYLRLINTALTNPDTIQHFESMLPPASEYGVTVPQIMEIPDAGAYLTSTNNDPVASLKWLDAQLETETMMVAANGKMGEQMVINDAGKYEIINVPENNGLYSFVPVSMGQFFAPGEYYTEVYQMAPHRVERYEDSQWYAKENVLEKTSYEYLTKLSKMNNDDATEANLIKTELEKFLKEAITDFIKNGVTDESWEAFQATSTEIGAPRYVQLYNDIHARELVMQPGDESGALPMAILTEAGDSCILQLASVQMLLTGSEADGSYVLDASDNLSFLSVCLGKMTERGSSATLDAGVKQLATQLITFDSQTQRQRVSALLLLLWPCLLGLALVIVRIVRRRL